MIEKERKNKTVKQAFKELIAGYDILNNLKFLAIAFFGLFGFFRKSPKKD